MTDTILNTCEKNCFKNFKLENNNDYETLDILLRNKSTKKLIDSDDKSLIKGKDGIYLGSEKLNPSKFSSFTRGLFQVEKEKLEFSRSYNNIQLGDKLFIWQTLSREGTDHIVGHIVTKSGKQFSFGYGYYGKEIEDSTLSKFIGKTIKGALYLANIKEVDSSLRQGVIYSPDYIFEHRISQQITKGSKTKKFLNLIASNVLTKEQVDTLKSKFDMIKSPINNLMRARFIFNDNYFISYFIKFEDLMYCAYSLGVSKAYTNCAGFLETMFSDIISCPGFISKYKPSPEKCYQISEKSTCDE